MPNHEHEYKPYGELEYCCRCNGMEGSMPTDCPGEPMAYGISDKVYSGNLDFRKDEGWVNKLSPMGRNLVKNKFFDMVRGREGCCKSDAEIIILIGTTREEYNKVKKECLKYLAERASN